MSDDLFTLPAYKISELVRRRELSAVEVAEKFSERIEAENDKLNGFVLKTPDEAIKLATEVDKRFEAGEQVSPLAGAPVGIKDIFVTRGIRTTCCSRILENYIPPYDATVVKKCKEAGLLIMGKLNMDEFAMGSSNENSAFGAVRNPLDLERVPGGSSGGSAAALAADLIPLATGTDTGGSIRQPAAFCGIVGLKPTYGRVSRYGIVAFASSLDQAGPMARNIKDLALFLQVIAGWDEKDSTSANIPVPNYADGFKDDLKGKRLGVPKEYFVEGLHAEIRGAIEAALKRFEALGAEIVEITLPHTEYAVPVYYLIATAEASSNLARYDGVRYGPRAEGSTSVSEMYERTRALFGNEVKRRIMLGTYALSAGYYEAYYLKAQKARTLISNDFKEAFDKVDAIITPTTPTPPFKLGEKIDDPLEMYLSDIMTIPANLAGICGLVMPCGKTDDGLPVGMQILGRSFGEGEILSVAHAYETAYFS